MSGSLENAQRILIVRLSALGDVVHALPMLDALRRGRPDAEIGWVVEEPAASLLANHPQIDRLWIAPRHETRRLRRERRYAASAGRLLGFARALRAARYDVTIDVQCNLRSAFWTRISGARHRIGFAPPYTKEKAHWWSTVRVEVPRGGQLKAHRDLELLQPFGVDVAGARPRLEIPESARAVARQLGVGSRRVALHPGVSAFGAFKRWAPERYAALARRLHEERGVKSIVTWGPGERELACRVVADSAGAAELAPRTRSLLELAAIFETCDVVVGADTGPVQLAAALGVPVLGLYGPKDPAIYGPLDGRTGEAAPTIWKRVHCSPCELRRCDNVICMPAIQVEDVLEAALATLGSEMAVAVPGAGA